MANRGLTGCDLCKSFTPHFHHERLNDPALRSKRPRVIFADSMSDWWSPGVEQSWRDACINAMYRAPQHQFVVLTKRPERITPEDLASWPDNAWLGVSVTGTHDWWRAWTLYHYKVNNSRIHTLLSIEPLLGPMPPDDLDVTISMMENCLEWAIMGGQTGPGAVAPEYGWIADIRGAMKWANVPLWEKENLPIPHINPDGEPVLVDWHIQQAPPTIFSILDDWGQT